ncbi:hypothetical protein EXE42_15455 [Halorubrum sp. SP3]|nr:hypothetical protein EXE42_15455 [Halorubrum sp. SP3]
MNPAVGEGEFNHDWEEHKLPREEQIECCHSVRHADVQNRIRIENDNSKNVDDDLRSPAEYLVKLADLGRIYTVLSSECGKRLLVPIRHVPDAIHPQDECRIPGCGVWGVKEDVGPTSQMYVHLEHCEIENTERSYKQIRRIHILTRESR